MEPQGGREFVQIVNIGHNHWITLSTVGCQTGHINVYDSLHVTFSSDVKELIADLLQWKGNYITIHYCDVQWQVGGNDCGIFAIAFATAICNGDEQASIMFDQNNMWNHLKICFDNGKLTPSPERSRKGRIKAAKEDTLPVHCTCRLPDKGDLMIQCTKCKTWYHTTCVNIPKSFLCRNCKDLLLWLLITNAHLPYTIQAALFTCCELSKLHYSLAVYYPSCIIHLLYTIQAALFTYCIPSKLHYSLAVYYPS